MNKIIDLGMHPFADTFISKEQLNLSEPVYPLQCFLDKDTGEIRVGCDTKADDRYNLYDYSYTSSNSKFARNHWIDYATEVSDKLNLNYNSKIIEVGSNDGFLSEQFKNLGYDVVGVDPSKYMAELAMDRGVKTYTVLFDDKTSEKIKNDFGTVDLIVANNVFNHSNKARNFVQGVVNLLNDDGVFVYELPYWYNTIKDKKFDQIYHEHVSYYTVKSSYELLKKFGLEIIDAEVVDYHGGSLRIFAKKVDNVKLNNHISDMISEEENFGLFEEETYKKFMEELQNKRNKFMKEMYDIKLQGYSIVGVGAAAKGNTFLNFYNLDNTILDYVTDTSEHKQGKYTPLTRIPIVGDEIFYKYNKVYALILSWNISDIIKESLKKINDKIEFLSLPE
jgi:2-polyprenyl-3-methyl-5-hydroxy-6-metoxy-1,4-benzoquinol methylase